MSTRVRGMGGHQSARMMKDEWLTPPEIIKGLGEFDLDPCVPINRPWDTAKNHYTIEDNGLKKKWFGKVWMNPPYGEETAA
ncbi:DNA N-6-adenine-methyltransferase [Paenibacillus medicaginis]|uniref:DNA N-6-adenine-methyltransferase n=1 Tax=Paenibacillus medicaginis TaxID=1470560 RepID=A0ABV5BVE1_9BACL